MARKIAKATVNGFVSTEQAALLVGLPAHLLRQAMNDGWVESLTVRSTPGAHIRIPLSEVIEKHEDVVKEVFAWRRATALSENRTEYPVDLRGGISGGQAKRNAKASFDRKQKVAAELRKEILSTVDAETVASLLGVSRPTIRRFEREGRLVGTRPIGPKQVRYSRQSVEALLNGTGQ